MLSSLFQVNTQIGNVCIALRAERTSIPAHLSLFYGRLEFRQIQKKEEKEDVLLKGKVT